MITYFKRIALAIGLITALNPGSHVWFENDAIWIEKQGEVNEIRVNLTEIGTAWSHTLGEEPIER